MKRLILSDIHIGDPRLTPIKQAAIVDLLLADDYDEIILNGDIIDLWLNGQDEALDNVIIKTLNGIKSKLIWLFGNHDPDIDAKYFIPGCEINETYQFTDGGKDFMVLHGHQVYAQNNNGVVDKLLTKLDVWAYNTFGIDFRYLSNRAPWSVWKTKCKQDQIINKYGGQNKTIIVGHSHYPSQRHSKQFHHLYDSGSIMECGSYLLIVDGRVEIKNI